MKKLFWFEIGILSLGWLSSIFFMLYAQGIFDSTHQWDISDIFIGIPAVLFAMPNLLILWLCKNFERFFTLIFLSSLFMVGISINAFYSVYFPNPAPAGGWIFIMVFVGQLIIAIVLLLIILILRKY